MRDKLTTIIMIIIILLIIGVFAILGGIIFQ